MVNGIKHLAPKTGSKEITSAQGTSVYGERRKYPHCYPDTHPQAKSNPQESWCYPLAALGAYREWLQDIYIVTSGWDRSPLIETAALRQPLRQLRGQLKAGSVNRAHYMGARAGFVKPAHQVNGLEHLMEKARTSRKAPGAAIHDRNLTPR